MENLLTIPMNDETTQKPLSFDADACMERAGFPRKFLRRAWTTPEIVALHKIPTERDDRGGFRDYKGLFLSGPTGTRKTASLCLAARDWLNKVGQKGSQAWRFVSFITLCSELQAAWRNDSHETPKEMIDDLVEVPFLILDEIGIVKTTDFVISSAYELLNRREWDEMPVFATSNLTTEQIGAKFDSRIASRLDGMCSVLYVGGKDGRKK